MIAVVYFVTWPWREVVLYRGWPAWLAAVFLFGTAILTYRQSRLGLASIQVGPRPERRLITSGMRQQIRHPIYLAHLCMLLAWTVGSGEVVLYGLTIFALLMGWPMIRQEEADLESRFGDEYRAYRRAVPAALIPPGFRWLRRGSPKDNPAQSQ